VPGSGGPPEGATGRPGRVARPALTAPGAGAPMVDRLPRGPEALERLFAYGTLMTGLARRPLLGAAILEGPGRVRGSLLDLGDYPGVTLDDGGWVEGELYRLPDLARGLARLDRAEAYDPADEAGSLYLRRRVAVHVADGPPRDAWLYVLNGPPGRGPRVPSGDWRAHLRARGRFPR
jgi:gamma-glutamylcyclotransferase (GGCT)/AIG2-like uncharacterized protein YtfP